MTELTAARFEEELLAMRSDEELRKHQRYFRFDPDAQPADDYFVGVRMGDIFRLAKGRIAMPVTEIEILMESPIHEVRVGALSIMGQSAKRPKCDDGRLAELYELYLRRHDRINNWDLVDLAAYYVVGKYLADRPRDPLYKLAASENPWQRRTAIVATAHFILKLKEVEDTFAISEILAHDPFPLVNKGTGWMLRTAGDVDRPGLKRFLDKYAATLPRITLRYAIEKLDRSERKNYMRLSADLSGK